MALRLKLHTLVLGLALAHTAPSQAEMQMVAPEAARPSGAVPGGTGGVGNDVAPPGSGPLGPRARSVSPVRLGPPLPSKLRPARSSGGSAPLVAPEPPLSAPPAAPGAPVIDTPGPELSPEPAAAWSSMGELALEGRAFAPDDDARTVDAAAALFARLEERYVRGALDQSLRVYGRADGLDRGRSTAVVEEAWLQFSTPSVRVRAGVDLVNWTAMEAFHPADVLNARNLDGDIESLEKRGEPMLAAEVRPFEGTALRAMVMPYRSTPLLPSPRSRLDFFPGLDVSGPPLFIDRDGRATSGRWGFQVGLTLRQVIGAADLSVHAIEHIDKLQPLLRSEADGQRAFLVFQTVRQFGGTYQHALGGLLTKAEVAYRSFVRPSGELPGVPLGGAPLASTDDGQPSHLIAAAGLEYLLSHGASESTVYLEGQMLLGVDDARERSVLSPFQRDVLVAYRWAANDEDDLQAMASAIIDTERPGELIFSLSHQRRLGETWSMQAGFRLFFAQRNAPSLVATLRRGDHAYLTITRHF